MGISFVRGAENTLIKQDTVIFDYMKKIEKDINAYKVLYFYTHKLQSQSLKAMQRQSLVETFETVVKKSAGEIFALPNEDIIVFFNKKCNDEVLACLVKVRFMFHDDPLIRNADDLEEIGFIKFYDLSVESGAFRDIIRSTMQEGNGGVIGASAQKSKQQSSMPSVYNTTTHKLRRVLTPEMLAKVQKILSVADFSSFIRRQSICAVIGKAPPQRVFEEVYVSIPDLREMLLPDVDLTANPWLFLSLSETLDKRVLETAMTMVRCREISVSTSMCRQFYRMTFWSLTKTSVHQCVRVLYLNCSWWTFSVTFARSSLPKRLLRQGDIKCASTVLP